MTTFKQIDDATTIIARWVKAAPTREVFVDRHMIVCVLTAGPKPDLLLELAKLIEEADFNFVHKH